VTHDIVGEIEKVTQLFPGILKIRKILNRRRRRRLIFTYLSSKDGGNKASKLFEDPLEMFHSDVVDSADNKVPDSTMQQHVS